MVQRGSYWGKKWGPKLFTMYTFCLLYLVGIFSLDLSITELQYENQKSDNIIWSHYY